MEFLYFGVVKSLACFLGEICSPEVTFLLLVSLPPAHPYTAAIRTFPQHTCSENSLEALHDRTKSPYLGE